MAGITLAQAEAKLTLWMAAEERIAAGQSYRIADGGMDRQLSRADLAEVGNRIRYWQNKVQSLTMASSGLSRARTIVN